MEYFPCTTNHSSVDVRCKSNFFSVTTILMNSYNLNFNKYYDFQYTKPLPRYDTSILLN